MIKKFLGAALVSVSAMVVAGAAFAADYNWTFQTSETAGEPGFVNKQKWAESVNKMSGGRIEIELLPIGSVVPHTDTLEAVGSGILQGHLTDPSYFAGKDPAFAMMGNLVGAWSDPFELLGFLQTLLLRFLLGRCEAEIGQRRADRDGHQRHDADDQQRPRTLVAGGCWGRGGVGCR